MSRSSLRSLASLTGCLLLSGAFLMPGRALAAGQFLIRAKTGDQIEVNGRQSTTRQGSFGAPSINDSSAVAYACILSGKGLDAFTNSAIVVRLFGKYHTPLVALRAADTVDDTFLPFLDGGASASFGRFYRFGINVALNNKNSVAFTGELLYTRSSGGDKPTFTTDEIAVYGIALPNSKKVTSYRNRALFLYLNYFEDILKETVSLNIVNSTAFSAAFKVTNDKFIPGVGYSSPNSGARIATTDSTVIGLPYFTTFQSFSAPVITSGNAVFLVADISDEGDEFDGIWRGNNPNLQPVVVKDTDAPSGGTFTSFSGIIGPSHNGEMCSFIANLANAPGGGGTGVFRINKNGSHDIPIAIAGQIAPGVRGEPIGPFTAFDLAATNNLGQVAFKGTAPGRKGISHSGIWISDKNGLNLQLVLMEGQTIDVDGTTKTLIAFAFNPISGLNNHGQVAFTATFSDRTSAVIIATFPRNQGQ